MATSGAVWARLRAPVLGHLAKALGRYWNDSCDRHAASVTYYAFLSLFPLLLVLGSMVGFVLRDEGGREERLQAYLSDYIPATLAERLVQILTDNAGAAGILGLAGLVIAGLGWVDTLRESIRAVWHQPSPTGSIVVKKLKDLLILAGLGLTVLVSTGVSAVATQLINEGWTLLGASRDQVAARALLWILALALALLSDVALFSYLLLWLPRSAEPFGKVVRAALFGAVLIEACKYLGLYYFGAVIDRGADAYGVSLAVAIGLLLWMNLIARVIMLTAAWAVTSPYRADVRPSGTASEPATAA
jgi:membrane protein